MARAEVGLSTEYRSTEGLATRYRNTRDSLTGYRSTAESAGSLSTEYRSTRSFCPSESSSIEASYSDPDLLIREYFLSSTGQRAITRRRIIQNIKSVLSVLAVASRGALGRYRDSYDGAVNLLSETDNIEILRQATYRAIRELYGQSLESSVSPVFTDNFIEILIKSVACAYKIDHKQRFNLIKQVLPLIYEAINSPTCALGNDTLTSVSSHSSKLPNVRRRLLKTSIIDALSIVADNGIFEAIEKEISNFTFDTDEYVSNYAAESLAEIG